MVGLFGLSLLWIAVLRDDEPNEMVETVWTKLGKMEKEEQAKNAS